MTTAPVRDNSNLSRTTGGTSFPGTEVPTMEFLVTMTTHVPDGTSGQAVEDVRGLEAARSRELAGQGHLLRLRVLPPQGPPSACGEPETPPKGRRSSNRRRRTAG
jgi:Muconolactone delta-isomerase